VTGKLYRHLHTFFYPIISPTYTLNASLGRGAKKNPKSDPTCAWCYARDWELVEVVLMAMAV